MRTWDRVILGLWLFICLGFIYLLFCKPPIICQRRAIVVVAEEVFILHRCN